VWYKRDKTFLRPKAHVYFDIRTPVAMEGPGASVMIRLLMACVSEQLTQESYYAQSAGLAYSLGTSAAGIRIKLRGYTCKMSLLLTKVLHALSNPVISSEVFGRKKEALLRAFQNTAHADAAAHARHMVDVVLDAAEAPWLPRDYIELVAPITVEDISAVARRLFLRVSLECFAHGNLLEEEVVSMVDDVHVALAGVGARQNEFEVFRATQLPSSSTLVYRYQEDANTSDNNAVDVYVPMGRRSLKADMEMLLLGHIASKPCFHQLRTVEQLGYLVTSGVRRFRGTHGFSVLVQSSSHSPSHLHHRIMAFLKSVREVLVGLDEATWNSHVESLIASKLKPSKTMIEETEVLWPEIVARALKFDRREHEAAELRTVTKQDVIDFYDKHLAGEEATALAIHVYGAGRSTDEELPEGAQLIEDIYTFRRGCPLHAAPMTASRATYESWLSGKGPHEDLQLQQQDVQGDE